MGRGAARGRRRSRPRRALLLLAGVVALATGCGLDESARVDCRCAPDTDVNAFPHCRGVEIDEQRPDADNPLSTRVPECPSGDLLFLREPTTPENVLFNVRDTFQGFSAIQYLDQLTEDFLFVPELTGLDLYHEIYAPPPDYVPDADADTLWDRAAERRFATNLLDQSRFQRITVGRWYDVEQDERILYPDNPRRETYIFLYILDFSEQPADDGSTRAFEVRGRLQVDLITPSAENPVWSIARMQDFRETQNDQTFTELRGEYAQ